MNPARCAAAVMSAVALLLSGCGKQQDSANLAQTTHPYPEVRMSAPTEQVARAESLAHANRLVNYRRPDYGYGFRYDSQKATLKAIGQGSVEFLHGSEFIGRLYTISVTESYGLAQDTSWGIKALHKTSLLPDTAFAIALQEMTVEFAADGDDGSSGLAMPPTSVVRDTTKSGRPFIEVFGEYYDQVFSTHTTSRHPLGPSIV
jgi:hypothetical protein